jgi:nitrogen fixation NifU-like protein
MMSAAVSGKTIEEVRDLTRLFNSMMSVHEASLDGDLAEPADDSALGTADQLSETDEKLGDLVALRGVLKFPVRIKCATLSWNTLARGIEEAAAQV